METEIVAEAGMTALLEHYSVLARAPQFVASDSLGLGYCIFRGGEDYFGIPLELVEEIVTRPDIMEVPASPPFLLGTLAHGAETLPVIDLAMCAAPLADPQYCLVLHLEGDTTIAIAADELLCPAAIRGAANSAEMQFTPQQAAARFISGRITWGSITAWALDPAQLTNALFASVMD